MPVRRQTTAARTVTKTRPSRPPAKTRPPRPRKWYLDGEGHISQSRSRLVNLTKKRYPEAAAGPIYSAPTLAGLTNKFPAIRSFQGKVVWLTPDTWAFNDEWSGWSGLYFVVDGYHKVFHSLEAAEHAWENTRDERASAKIFVTPDIDEATERVMPNDLKMSNRTRKDESIPSVINPAPIPARISASDRSLQFVIGKRWDVHRLQAAVAMLAFISVDGN
ncbi:hypothetical protein B0H14DRAFT_3440390 [Mycena olivaceomarginata]|nr:hypothetical protein B0H14DRAFT_3440390 [Mycena olivaceomarginata]